MLNIKFIDEEKYPLEASESGDNAFYFAGCPTSSGRVNYASCLAKCAARDKGRLDERYSDCSALIGKRQCPAQKMRIEEKQKGMAIHFVSRPKLVAFNEYRERMEKEADDRYKETGKKSRKASEDFDDTGAELATFNSDNIVGFRPRATTGNIGYEEVELTEEQRRYKDRCDEVLLARGNSEVGMTFEPGASSSEIMAQLLSAEVAKQTTAEEAARPVVTATASSTKKPRPPIEPGESPLAYARRVQAMTKEEGNE